MASESAQLHVPRQSGPRGAAVWGAQQGGRPFLPLGMALPSLAPVQQGGRRWKTPFPGWDPGHPGPTEASLALSLLGACSWAKPVMLGTTLGDPGLSELQPVQGRRSTARPGLPGRCLGTASSRKGNGLETLWVRTVASRPEREGHGA